MYTQIASASQVADRGKALVAVAMFHLALGYALYSGLATTIGQKLMPEPFHVVPLPQARPTDPIPLPPPVESSRIAVLQPEIPWAEGPAEEGPQMVAQPTASGATASIGAPTAAPVMTPVSMDPRHPLRIGEDYYPPSAIRLEQEGRCVVNLTVAADGRIVEATLRSSSGVDVLDAACLNAVRGQRMLPAKQDGIPVQSHAAIPIVWKLRRQY